ncbi:MAG: hypothetical protein Q9176_004734 [Flavoplaca citrina]
MDHMMGQLYAEFKNNNNNNNDKGKGKEMTAENLDPTTVPTIPVNPSPTSPKPTTAILQLLININLQVLIAAATGTNNNAARHELPCIAKPTPKCAPAKSETIKTRKLRHLRLIQAMGYVRGPRKTDSSELQILGVRRRRILDNKQHQRPPEDTEYLHKGVMDWKTNTKTLEQILLKQEKDYEMQIQNLRS